MTKAKTLVSPGALLPTWINFIASQIPLAKTKTSEAPFYPAWISNYILCKAWDEITYPLPNFNGAVKLHISSWQVSYGLSVEGILFRKLTVLLQDSIVCPILLIELIIGICQ